MSILEFNAIANLPADDLCFWAPSVIATLHLPHCKSSDGLPYFVLVLKVTLFCGKIVCGYVIDNRTPATTGGRDAYM